MTPLPTQSSAQNATTADPVLGWNAPTEPAAEDRGFDKVFREAADETEAADPETQPEDSDKTKAKDEAKAEAQAARQAQQAQRAKELAGLGHATPVSADPANQSKAVVKAAQSKGTPTSTAKTAENLNQAIEPKESKAKVDPNAKAKAEAAKPVETNEAKAEDAKATRQALQARRQAAAKRTGRLNKQQATRAQLKSEDAKHAQAKAQLAQSTEIRQNLPTLALANSKAVKPGQTADKAGNLTKGEWELVNGTQVAQNNAKMAMMAKTTAPAPEGSVARWEELRPATSAELGGGASGQQQDLPREQAREFTAPVQAVATPAATGTAPTQAFVPTPGQVSATLEKIWNAVTTFRAKGADQWTVKLQTDNQTQMQLTIRYSQSGLEIQARLGQGDGQQLAGQWSELQQTLAERGVTLRDLTREEPELPRFSKDLDEFNSSDSPESRRHASAGEEDEEPLNWNGLDANREGEEPSATRRAPARAENSNWESWA